MAVKRTGIVYTAKKLRFKQSSARPPQLEGRRRAPSFFGRAKKPKNLFGWLALVLEITGRPFLRLLLIVGYLFLILLSLVSKTTLLAGKSVLWFFKKLPKVFSLLFKGIITVNYFFSILLSRFSYLVSRLTHLVSSIVYRLSRLRFPKIKPPKIKLPRLILIKPGKKAFILLGIFLSIFTFSFLIFNYILKDLPHPNRLITREQIISTKIYDRSGKLLYKIYRSQNRTLVPLAEIPMPMIQATLAIEDAEFYHHPGFSIKGITRAFFQNLKGEKLHGGSTITQQLVKNALLSPERTLRRKIKEILLALWVEQRFTKDEILQMYFNEVGYGGAAYGVEEAAQMYFGKSVRDLTLPEAALLAGLPASPTTHSPFGAHPEKAKERQTLVLKRMLQEGFITKEEGEKTKERELHFAPQRTDIKAPHFVMYVKELLVEKYGLQMVEEGGLEVTTSLDPSLQNKIQAIVRQEVNRLWELQITNGAALVTHPSTGEILAMVGSRDYFDLENDGNVNVTLCPRQPGSAIKPVNYSVALENGFTPATIIPDTPITYRLPGQQPYSPRNYDGRFHGNIPLRVALASSYNVPAVKVLSALGVERMVKRGQEMGITTWDDPSRFGLSLTLGGGEVKMIDMAVVYGILANMGTRVDLNPILEVKNYKGEVLETTKNKGQTTKRALPPEIAYILTDILSDNSARTPAFGPNSVLIIPDHPHVAVKTGTTQNLRDNLTIGYTPDYLVAVWVGNNDNTSMSYVASGITGASPIWNEIMSHLLKDIPDKEFPKPEDLKQVEICALTNTLPCEGCGGKWEYFVEGTEPKNHCSPEKIKEIVKEKEEKSRSVTF